MFSKKLTKVIQFKRWISFQRLDSIIKHISCHNSFKQKLGLRRYRSVKSQPKFTSNHNYNPVESAHAYKIIGNIENHFFITSSVEENSYLINIESLVNKQWTNMSKSEILKNFKIISWCIFKNQGNLNNSKYCEILEATISQCSSFTDYEFHYFLNCLEVWNSELYNTIYKDICVIIDKECLKRMQNWSVNIIFLFNDHLYKLQMTKASKFGRKTLKSMLMKNMSKKNLVQYAFLMKVNPRITIKFNIFEHFVLKYVNEMTTEEIGIICMAFVKYERTIEHKNLIKLFMYKLHDDINTVSDIALGSILKVLRSNIDLSIIKYYGQLLKILVPQASSRSLFSLTQIAHIQASILMCNDDLISKILERFGKEISKARLKDIERVLFTLFIFNCNPNTTSFYCNAINEVLSPHRNQEIIEYTGSFLYIILYTLQANYYHEEALTRVMDPSFINHYCKNNFSKLSREYLTIDYCIEIEHPEYTGPRLEKYMLNFLKKKFGALKKYELCDMYNKRDILLAEIAHTCKKLFGAESAIHIDTLLPHLPKKNVIVCYNRETKTVISPAEKLSEIPLGEIKYAPKDGNEWYVLLSGTHNFLIRNTLSPTGFLQMEIRHLKRIGYKPIVIPYVDWKKRSNNNKLTYIKNALNI